VSIILSPVDRHVHYLHFLIGKIVASVHDCPETILDREALQDRGCLQNNRPFVYDVTLDEFANNTSVLLSLVSRRVWTVSEDASHS
jgi:hypothetical protein